MKRNLQLIAVALILTGAGNVALAAHQAHASNGTTKFVNMVNQKGDEPWAYRPVKITVRAGTRVVWRNRSSEAHTVTGTGKRPAFDSGLSNQIAPKRQWSHVFNKTGTYSYYCFLHPYMKGKVVVQK